MHEFKAEQIQASGVNILPSPQSRESYHPTPRQSDRWTKEQGAWLHNTAGVRRRDMEFKADRDKLPRFRLQPSLNSNSNSLILEDSSVSSILKNKQGPIKGCRSKLQQAKLCGVNLSHAFMTSHDVCGEVRPICPKDVIGCPARIPTVYARSGDVKFQKMNLSGRLNRFQRLCLEGRKEGQQADTQTQTQTQAQTHTNHTHTPVSYTHLTLPTRR